MKPITGKSGIRNIKREPILFLLSFVDKSQNADVISRINNEKIRISLLSYTGIPCVQPKKGKYSIP
jgi:hypothetical protein